VGVQPHALAALSPAPPGKETSVAIPHETSYFQPKQLGNLEVSVQSTWDYSLETWCCETAYWKRSVNQMKNWQMTSFH